MEQGKLSDGGDVATRVAKRIFKIRGWRVILDADVADFFETTTSRVNQYRKRNADRFTLNYAFELTDEEFQSLKSQNVLSGSLKNRRYAPWAYTEHGFTMLSMGMQGARAAMIAHVVIDTFVQYRRGLLVDAPVLEGPEAPRNRRAMIDAIYTQMQSLLSLPMPGGGTVSTELKDATRKAIDRVKAVIDQPVVNQQKLLQEIALIEAKTAKTYSEIHKMDAETQKIWVDVLHGRLDLIARMREMATQLERDEVAFLSGRIFDQMPMDGGTATLPVPGVKITKRDL